MVLKGHVSKHNRRNADKSLKNGDWRGALCVLIEPRDIHTSSQKGRNIDLIF
jgi:hypothetical protein